MPRPSSGQEYLREYRAAELQRRADQHTAFRQKHSRKAGIAVGALPRNWFTFGACAYLAWTDWRDGHLAKKAQATLGVNGPLTDGHIKDPIADKTFRKELSRGILARVAFERDIETIGTLTLKSLVDKKRDVKMAAHRVRATEHELSVAAIQINRVKTAIEMAGMLLHVSPLANNETVRRTALGMMATSTGIGLVGERQYGNMVQEQISAQQIPAEVPVTMDAAAIAAS